MREAFFLSVVARAKCVSCATRARYSQALVFAALMAQACAVSSPEQAVSSQAPSQHATSLPPQHEAVDLPPQLGGADTRPSDSMATSRQGGHLRWHAITREARLPRSARIAIFTTGGGALNHDETLLFIGNSGNTRVQVLDPNSLEVLATTSVGDAPDIILPIHNGRLILAGASFGRLSSRGWGAYRRASKVFILDGTTGALRGELNVGENFGDLLELRDGSVVVSTVHGARITRFNPESLEVYSELVTRRDGFTPGGLAMANDQSVAVASGGVFDVSFSQGLRTRPRGSEILFFDPLDPAERVRIEFMDTLFQPRTPMFHPDGRHVLFPNRGADTLTVLDWQRMQVVDTLDVGVKPEQLGSVPETPFVWLRNDGERSISFIHLGSGEQHTCQLSGLATGSPIVSADGQFLYIPTRRRNGVAVVELGSQRQVDFIPLKGAPSDLVLDRSGTRLYAIQPGANRVSLIQ